MGSNAINCWSLYSNITLLDFRVILDDRSNYKSPGKNAERRGNEKEREMGESRENCEDSCGGNIHYH